MSLLHMMHVKNDAKYIVAHFNHGIRSDSNRDEELVRETAKKYKFIFEVGHGMLGADAGEAAARKARYEFLGSVQKKHNAKSIITAHHQDDVIETALINLVRGTGRRGLNSLKDENHLERPLLNKTKKQLYDYAKIYSLNWREDSTNSDTDKLRNLLRKTLDSTTASKKQALLREVDKVAEINNIIDTEIATLSHNIYNSTYSRLLFAQLSDVIAREVMMQLFRDKKISNMTRAKVSKSAIFVKTARSRSVMSLDRRTELIVGDRVFELRQLRNSLI